MNPSRYVTLTLVVLGVGMLGYESSVWAAVVLVMRHLAVALGGV